MVLYGIPCMSQGISVRNNLLWDASGTANIGLEIPISEHWTIGANAGFKSWPRFHMWDTEHVDNTRHWRHLAVAPELRFWPSRVYDGWFLGADALYAFYNVGNVKFPLGLYKGLRDHRAQGSYYAGGVFAGRSWWLSDRWRIEAEAGLAAGVASYDRFNCDHCSAKIGDASRFAVLPKLGLNIAYNLTKRQQKRQELVETLTMLPESVQEEPKKEEPVIVEVPKAQEPQEPVTVVPSEPEEEPVPELLRNPLIRPASEYTPYSPERVLRKEEGALYVYFRFNSSKILSSFTAGKRFRDNAPVLDEIISVTEKVLKDSTFDISCIQIVGLASTEGALWTNTRLAERRAKALKAYIQEKLPVPDNKFEAVGGGEAWSDLRDIVQDMLANADATTDSEKIFTKKQLQSVLDIIDSEPDLRRREDKLRAIEGGSVFRKLIVNVMGDLRNSGFIRIYVDNNIINK